MKKPQIAIIIVLCAMAFSPNECWSRGGGMAAHHGGGMIAPHGGGGGNNYNSAGPGGYAAPLSRGYGSYRHHGYGGYRRWGYGGGGYGYNQGAYYEEPRPPVSTKFDEWNRAEIKRMSSLPTSAFVKEYNWGTANPAPNLQSSGQLAGKAGALTH